MSGEANLWSRRLRTDFRASLVIVAILVSSSGPDPTAPRAPSPRDVTAILRGIPQQGLMLGDPKAPVLLVEFAVSSANEASLGKDADMIMLAFPGGKERTDAEYRALFEQSGFRLSKVTPTRSAVCVIEGRPA